MAMHAKEQILPWVDNIVSRMVYYFSSSSCVSALRVAAAGAAPREGQAQVGLG